MTQSILYGSSGVSWQSLDHGFHVLMDAWKRHQRRFPFPGAVLASAMKVLRHRLFLRYADRVGWKQEHYRQFFNPFWLEPTAFTAAETFHQPVPQVSLVYHQEFLKHPAYSFYLCFVPPCTFLSAMWQAKTFVFRCLANGTRSFSGSRTDRLRRFCF